MDIQCLSLTLLLSLQSSLVLTGIKFGMFLEHIPCKTVHLSIQYNSVKEKGLHWQDCRQTLNDNT